MALRISNRVWILLALIGFAAAVVALVRPVPSAALPAYAAATGQACATCHVNPAGGGPRTALGQAFEAIPTHATDPAGAWAQVSGAAAATPAPTTPTTPAAPSGGKAGPPAPAPAPAPAAPASATMTGIWSSGPMTLMLSGAAQDGTVAYSVTLRNTSKSDILNSYLALSLPDGTTMSGKPSTPEGAVFVGQDGGAAWIINDIPAASATTGVMGPFVFTVSKGSASDLSASAFVHWLQPTEGSFSTPMVTPISNDARMAIDQSILNSFNTADRTTSLWNIQPGLGTVMIEYATRLANQWFAAQAGNWDMVRYQIDEMKEIQEVGEATRPGRAPALKHFETTYLDPLDAAAESKDLKAYEAAYDNTINGCNSCHASSTGVAPNPSQGAKFIKVKRPTTPVLPDVDWAGQQ